MKRLPAILLGVLLVAFVAGLLHVLQVRFARGDVYPPASSFRSDPLGTRAFHDALAQVTTVRRHVQSFAGLGEGRNSTLLLLGADRSDLRQPAGEFQHLQSFVADGGRLVLALKPEIRRGLDSFLDKLEKLDDDELPRQPKKDAGTNSPAAKKTRARRTPSEAEELERATVSLATEWRFTLDSGPTNTSDTALPKFTVRRRGTNALPAELNWHSPAAFRATNSAWQVIYTGPQKQAVAIERRVGRGSVVLLTDCWHFTNEALRDDRQPAWLAWLVGPQRRVIFDETHLGISEEPGVASLARRYRLHGVFAALLVLAGLFIWRNSTSFPPVEAPLARAAANSAVLGREAAEGFVSLLRRNLPVASLAQTCFTAWRQACARSTPPARLAAADAAFAADGAQSKSGNSVTALYRKLSQILNRNDFKA